MKRNAFTIFITTAFLISAIDISCKRIHFHPNERIEVIRIDTKDKRLGNPIKIGQIIPLETNKDCLIGYIKKLIYWNNKIMVMDEESQTFFLFDESGKLIFKTLKGKGPDEVIAPTNFNIDKKDTTILLYQDWLKKFSRYDFNGKEIESKKIVSSNKIIIKDFYPLGRDTFLVFHSNISNPGNDEPRLTTWSLLTDDLSNVKKFDITLNKNKAFYYVTQPVSISSGLVLFVVPWSYDIYCLIGNDYKKKYSIDFGNASFLPEQREILSTRDLYRKMVETKKIGCLVSVMFERDLLIIDADYGEGSQVFIHSLINGRTICLNNYIEKGILPKCRIWGMTGNSVLYATVEPLDYIDFVQLHPDFLNLPITCNSNPIIISLQTNDIF